MSTVANTMYYFRYRVGVDRREVGKLVAGVSTVLGTPYAQTLSVGIRITRS